MNIRLKLVLSAAALAAGCVLLAGCGGSASSASSAASSAASSEAASPSASSEPTASVSAEENGASDAVASAVDALLEADPKERLDAFATYTLAPTKGSLKTLSITVPVNTCCAIIICAHANNNSRIILRFLFIFLYSILIQ